MTPEAEAGPTPEAPAPATTTRFDRDTAVTPLGEGVFEARIDRGWWIVRGPNGGYLAAILLRALDAAVGDPERLPRSLTLHFTRPPAEGPVRIETRLERAGRSLSTVSARMLQDGRLQAVALAAFSKARQGPELHHAPMPEVTPPEAVPARSGLPGAPALPMRERYEQRWVLGAPPGTPGSAQALSGGWIRLAEPRALDALLVAALSDAWPPAIFSSSEVGTLSGGVPTVDLTIHFRAPLPLAAARVAAQEQPWVFAAFRSREARDGFVEEDGELWSRDGVLLAQSRQLAVLA